MSTEKTCRLCGEAKPLESFYKHPFGALGRDSKCKECSKGLVRANYQKNKAHYQAYERERWKDPVRKSAVYASIKTAKESDPKRFAAYKKAYSERNPEVRRAHSIVSGAIRSGKLKQCPCEQCGEAKSQAHHDDYREPLAVRWLCIKCHNLWHKENMPLGLNLENRRNRERLVNAHTETHNSNRN